MRQVIIPIAIVIAVILSFGQVSAQQDTVYIRTGTQDFSVLAVGLARWHEIPVFFMGNSDIWVGDIYHVFGARRNLFTFFDIDSCRYLYPFTGGDNGWSVKEFGDYNDDTSDYPNPPGWHSLSFTGNARSIYPDAPFLHTNPGEWQNILLYTVRTTLDIDLLDQEICDAFGPAHGPYEDAVTNCSDTLGTTDFEVIESFTCVWFSPNTWHADLMGTVTDISEEPIESVHVEVKNELGEVVNDGWTWIDGVYNITVSQDAIYDVTFSHDEYFEHMVEDVEVTYMRVLDATLLPDTTDMIVMAGNIDGSPIVVSPGQILEIPVYFLGHDSTINVDWFNYPMAINNAYIDSFVTEQCYNNYPDFDVAVFGDFNEDYMTDSLGNTWDSYTFSGIVWASPPYTQEELIRTYPGDPPIKIATFAVYVRNNLELDNIIVEDAFDIGYGPINGDAWFQSSGKELHTFTTFFSPLMFSVYEYLPGDVNMPNGIWPPSVIGGDVTYLVGHLRGGRQRCDLDGFWASADANGDCLVIGSDVTKLVTYFRGATDLAWCPDYPPAWPTPDDLPDNAPQGWPNCEEYDD